MTYLCILWYKLFANLTKPGYKRLYLKKNKHKKPPVEIHTADGLGK